MNMSRKSFVGNLVKVIMAAVVGVPWLRSSAVTECNLLKYGWDEPTNTWRFSDCVFVEGEVKAAALNAELKSKGVHGIRVIAIAVVP
jgi:hypothetical protein